jgi:predicted metal-binding membrane protein
VSPPQSAILSRRDRVIVSSCLVLLTALAWAYLLHLDRRMSAAMEYDRMMANMGMTMDMPWRAADVFFTFAMWAVMMVGMMTPSAAPMLLLVAGMDSARGARSGLPIVFAFGAGYLLVWTVFSAGAALAQWALHRAALLSPAMTTSNARLGGVILI